MGVQGFHSAEGNLLTKRDLALLANGEVVRMHIHTQHQDPLLKRILNAADRHHQVAPVLPKRLATFSRPIYIQPDTHNGEFMAIDYMVTMCSEPLRVSKSYGVKKPEGFKGGRGKLQAEEITWLNAPTDKPRAQRTRSLRRLRGADQPDKIIR